MAHKRCVRWRKFPVSYGVETLSQMAYGDCVIWRKAVGQVERTETLLPVRSPISESLFHLAHLSISIRKVLVSSSYDRRREAATVFVVAAAIGT